MLVCENEDDGVPHFSVVDDPMQLLSGLVDPVSVGAVDDEDQALSAGVVVAPERSDLVLTSHILKFER